MVASAFEFDFSRTDTAHSGFKGNMAVLMHWDPFCDYLCTIGLYSSVCHSFCCTSFLFTIASGFQFGFPRFDSAHHSFNWNFGFTVFDFLRTKNTYENSFCIENVFKYMMSSQFLFSK